MTKDEAKKKLCCCLAIVKLSIDEAGIGGIGEGYEGRMSYVMLSARDAGDALLEVWKIKEQPIRYTLELADALEKWDEEISEYSQLIPFGSPNAQDFVATLQGFRDWAMNEASEMDI